MRWPSSAVLMWNCAGAGEVAFVQGTVDRDDVGLREHERVDADRARPGDAERDRPVAPHPEG